MAHWAREETTSRTFRNNSGRYVLLRAAALLALGYAPLVFGGDDGNEPDFEPPKPQKVEKPSKSKLVKNENGSFTDSSYQPVDSFGKVGSSKNSSTMMGADAGLSSEELRDKYSKNIQDQIEKMKKLQLERDKKASKNKSSEKEKDKEQKDEKSSSREFVVPGNGTRVLEFNGESKGRQPSIIEPNKGSETRQTIEIGSGKAKKTNSVINDKTGDGVDTLKPGSMVRLPVKGEAPKRSFWDKLTGRNKEETAKINLSENNGQVTIDGGEKAKATTGDAKSFTPRSNEYRSTATQRLADIMDRKRLLNGPVAGEETGASKESGENEKDFEAKKEAALASANAGAEVVDLSGEKKAIPEIAGAPSKETVPSRVPEPQPGSLAEAVDPLALPETDLDTQIEAERAYREGLKSRDIVIREAAYQRAAWEKRSDAVPFLVEEVKQGAPLAVLAAEVLGVLPYAESTELLLLKELVGYDPMLRKACAESLGRMRSRRALAVLAERIRADKNPKARFPFIEPSLPARSACVDALGAIGEREAIGVLKAKLEDAGEIEFVKSRAALSLARLGDPSGRAHLIKNLDSPSPAMQVIGIQGLAQLNDSGVAPYLGAALESRHDEVWSTAILMFPRLGAANALPLLRQRIENGNEITRRRAALAMGYLGSDEGIMYIDRAVRYGSVAERVMGCELIAQLARTDCAPLLVEKLQDPSGNVRMNAAMALTRMNITDAAGAIVEASRGVQSNSGFLEGGSFRQPDNTDKGKNLVAPAWARNYGADAYERLVMLSCVRVLRGEKDDLVITTLPSTLDNKWPEVDRVMAGQQTDLLKMYEFVDVIASGGQPIGVVLRAPNGQELTYRPGEAVAGGFKVRDIGIPPANPAANQKGLTAYVTLVKGDDRITLAPGKEPAMDSLRKKEK